MTTTRCAAEDPHVGDVWVHDKLIVRVERITGDPNVRPGRMVHYSVDPSHRCLNDERSRHYNEWPRRVAGFRFMRNDPLGSWTGWEQ